MNKQVPERRTPEDVAKHGHERGDQYVLDDPENPLFDGATVYVASTRRSALEDGMYVELPVQLLREIGIKVAKGYVTGSLFEKLNPKPDEEAIGQDLTGRLWDMLSVWHWTMVGMARRFERSKDPEDDPLMLCPFEMLVQRADGKMETLKIWWQPSGDHDGPFGVWMLPEDY